MPGRPCECKMRAPWAATHIRTADLSKGTAAAEDLPMKEMALIALVYCRQVLRAGAK
jgi:hypothetical protein